MDSKSLPIGWGSGVLSQGAGNSCCPLTPQSQKEVVWRWKLSGAQAGTSVGFGGFQAWEAGVRVLALL